MSSTVEHCRRCIQTNIEQTCLNIYINRDAWLTVLNSIIPLAQQNALSVNTLTNLRNALRADLLKLRSRRRHMKYLESKRPGLIWRKIGDLYIDENGRPVRILFNAVVFSTLDLTVEPGRPFDKHPIQKCVRMKRAKSV